MDFLNPENLRKQLPWLLVAAVILLLGLITFFYLFSVIQIISVILIVPLTIYLLKNHYYALVFLLIYIPLETIFLKIVPSDIYFWSRYWGEILIYLLFLKALAVALQERRIQNWFHNPLFKWIIFFLIIGVLSAIFNLEDPVIAALGLRQVLRMSTIFFVMLIFKFDKKHINIFIKIFIAMIIFQAALGLIQYAAGGAFDSYLLPSESHLLGESVVLKGVSKQWVGGVRAFATMGRYERFGIFLLFGLLFYIVNLHLFPKQKRKLLLAMLLIVAGIIVSYTRSVWITSFFLIPFVSYYYLKNKRIIYLFILFIVLFVVYLNVFLFLSNTQLSQYIDSQTSSLNTRLVESFSYDNLRNSYYTWGRVYYWVETVRRVVPASPLVGFGPGQYGSGVTAAMHINTTYSKFYMPFGITNETGMVDSNWMSILGEFGVLGFLAMVFLLFSIVRNSKKIFLHNNHDNNLKIVSFVVGSMALAFFALGMFWPIFEYRVINFYFWFLCGLMFNMYLKQQKA